MRMDAKIKKEWVSALRSGEYEQGQGFLAKNDKYCCLGVLCDLAVKAGVEVIVYQQGVGSEAEITYYGGTCALPPKSVIEWAGLEDDNPSVPDTCLAEANDDGESFEYIAGLIEIYL